VPRQRDLSAALLRLPISEAPYAFVDVETTGLSPWAGDRVCEIAIVRCQGEVEVGQLSTLVNPLRPISPGAYRVNGITPGMVAGAPTFDQLAREIRDALDGCVLVAHNAGFDVGFLARELALAGMPRPAVRVVDTLSLARRHYHYRHNSLSDLSVALGLPATPHRALGDAQTVREVFRRIAREALPAGSRVASLLRLQGEVIDWPARPAAEDSIGEIAEAISMALLDGKRLLLAYESREGERTERWVDPIELTSISGEPCLVAFCHLRAEKRTFLLRRIARLERASEATE
jgi:DNA polymerase-3 subunit epsilon